MAADEKVIPTTSQPTNNKNDQTWNTVTRKRQRNSPELNISKKRQTQIQDYWLSKPVATNNSFEELQNIEDTIETTNSGDENSTIVKVYKSPPIYVSGVEDISPLKTLLDKIAINDYTLKILSNNEVKILPNSSDKYLMIIEELKKKNTEFFTYQRKQDKSYKTVLRHIHPSVDLEEIKNAIEEYEHKVLKITNIRDSYTQKPLPLFFVEIQPNDNNKTIYNINKLLNTIVNFEPPHKKRDIPQCMKCQGFGHTKNYCFRSPVCVKCADKHLTKDCPIKEKTPQVKCANCEGNHPASYKGCAYRKQLQQKLFPKLREKTLTQNMQYYAPSNNNSIKPNISFAQATGRRPQQLGAQSLQTQHEPQITTNTAENVNTTKLEQMMFQLMTRMDTMLNLLTSLINKIQQ